MNILFLSMLKITSLDQRGIYTDLLREFVKNKDNVYIVSPSERREKKVTKIIKEKRVTILRVNTLNLQKASLIEKGIGQLILEKQFLREVKSNFKKVKFDLVLYSTPPITFSNVVSYIKKRDNAYSYLLLKDIFPQNAVDLKMIKRGGILHRFFLKKEKNLYENSDKIGCMSPANLNYVLKHNQWLSKDKVEINPNTIAPITIEYSSEEKIEVREKYNIPCGKKVFVYGGNLGKPQGVDFLLSIIENCKNPDAFFLIVGSGTEFIKIKQWFETKRPRNAKLLSALCKEDYDKLLASCDIGMIFLHKDFTIPNFPSRLLSYLEMGFPIFAATDLATDLGEIVEKEKCGFWVESGNLNKALKKINEFIHDDRLLEEMKEKSKALLEKEYMVEKTYKLISNAINYV
ncbi:glycosyltransferase family 4 protein [uncultured Tenacibaculum sp.]|uniref:glycosyltransferase family 4 protein n=1 Tax=uncultured Tenacibaculum sp. TaxID=174713 RepID=UPI00260332D1|nr:glycosyltransferase family 4 protein [uncultured Tenacibaculum sp.]